jgi:glycosyltransferase involved in cell wall biosynthesis
MSAFEVQESDIILLHRFYPIEESIINTIKQNRKIVWIHDIPDISIFVGNDSGKYQYYRNNVEEFKRLVLSIIEDPLLTFVANSKHTHDMFIKFIEQHTGIQGFSRCTVVYNILYGEEFDTATVEKIPMQLIYASAWQKGIEKVIDIFRNVRLHDSRYTLVLLSPGYDWENFKGYANKLKSEFGDSITIMGPCTKKELSNAIKQSMCCLTSTFNETFGCVFAECYYLGTPVIADIQSGAVKEIIGDENIVDYNNIHSVINKLSSIVTTVSLNERFLPEINIDKWCSIIAKKNATISK